MKNRINDISGVTDFPFRLIIASVIMLITISIVGAGLYQFSKNKVENDVQMEIAKIERAVNLCRELEHSARITVDIDISSSLAVYIKEIKIGDEVNGGSSNMVNYHISSGKKDSINIFNYGSAFITHIVDKEGDRITESKPFRITGPTITLVFTHLEYRITDNEERPVIIIDVRSSNSEIWFGQSE